MMDEMKRAIVPLALLGLFAIAGFSIASEPAHQRPASDAQLSGAPVLPETVVAPNATPVGPCLTPVLAAAAHVAPEPVLCPPAPSKLDRHVFLVEARVYEKYLSFRESLTSP
jgi:hypothetical protein